MRKLSLAFVAAMAAACGGSNEEAKAPAHETTSAPATGPVAEAPKETPKEAPKPALSDLQKKALDTLAEATTQNDAKKVAAHYTDDATLVLVGMGEAKGRDAIEKALGEWHASVQHSKFAVTRAWMKNDVAVYEWAAMGKHTGDVNGVKATGKPVGFLGLSVAWFDETGKIKREHTYLDGNTLMGQIGATKQKVRPVLASVTPGETVAAKGTADDDKNVETLKSFYGAFEKFSTEKDKKKADADLFAFIADDFTHDDNSMADSAKGKDVARKGITEWTKAFPDMKMKTENVWGFGDTVVVEQVSTGTHKGAFAGKPATNKTVTLHGVDIVHFKDGKIDHMWTYGNGSELAMQLGWIKAPAPAKTDAPKADAAKTADAKAPAAKDAKATDAKAAAPAKKP